MKFLLFDFDGVLVNSFQLCYESMLATSPDAFSPDEYRAFFHGNIYESTKSLKEDEKPVTSAHPFFQLYSPALLQTHPVLNMREALVQLSKNNGRKMVIVSSSIGQTIETYLERYHMQNLFSAIYGADVHRSKVIKIQMALDTFGATPEESLFITDTLGDVREATKLGLRSIGVPWGFHSIETLQRGNPLAIANSPEELVSLIEETIR